MRIRPLLAWGILGLASTAQAQPIMGGTSGLANPTQTVTFSELSFPSGTPVTNEWAAGYGLTFSPGAYYDPQPNDGFFSTPSIGNYSFCCGSPISPVSIVFSQVVNGVAMNFLTNPGVSTFEAFLAGNLVSTFSVATDYVDPSLWYGFDNTQMDEIRLTPGQGYFLLDNLQTSAVPEPASVALMATGLLALAGVVRRRQKAR